MNQFFVLVLVGRESLGCVFTPRTDRVSDSGALDEPDNPDYLFLRDKVVYMAGRLQSGSEASWEHYGVCLCLNQHQ